MTRRDIIGRGGAILAAIAGSLSLFGGGKKAGGLFGGGEAAEIENAAFQMALSAQWDTPPQIIFKKSKDGTPERTIIAWKATYGHTRKITIGPDRTLTFDGTEPAQYGDWRELSSDNPPMSELQDALAGFDRLQRETLARISRA